METLRWLYTNFVNLFFKLDETLNGWAADLGAWTYVLLFTIVFCETGLVVTPFLPGDSLLFAVGALSASKGSPIDPVLVSVLLIVAAVLGDAVNYAIGYRLGPKVFSRPSSRLLNTAHLLRAQAFYEKHGGKAIILARFVPIIRTFAPFVAGIGKMSYARFAMFNVVGAVVWVISLVFLGWKFGGLPWVKDRFQYVVLAIIFISVLPIAFEWWRAWRSPKAIEPVKPVEGPPPA